MYFSCRLFPVSSAYALTTETREIWCAQNIRILLMEDPSLDCLNNSYATKYIISIICMDNTNGKYL